MLKIIWIIILLATATLYPRDQDLLIMDSKKDIAIISATSNDNEYIENKIIEFNRQQVPFTQETPFIPLNFVIKDDEGNIRGGIAAVMYCWHILYINVLWIDDHYRKQGYGALLLEKVEQEAINLGCRLVHLDTFYFQAKDFYLRHDYEIFGQLDNCPQGHTKFFMKKILSPVTFENATIGGKKLQEAAAYDMQVRSELEQEGVL